MAKPNANNEMAKPNANCKILFLEIFQEMK